MFYAFNRSFLIPPPISVLSLNNLSHLPRGDKVKLNRESQLKAIFISHRFQHLDRDSNPTLGFRRIDHVIGNRFINIAFR